MGSKRSSKNPSNARSSPTPADPPVDGNHQNPKNSSLVTPSKSRKKEKLAAPVSNDSNVLYLTPSTHGETDSQNSNCRGKAPEVSKEISPHGDAASRSCSLRWGEDGILKLLRSVIALREKSGFLLESANISVLLKEIKDWAPGQFSEKDLDRKLRHLQFKFHRGPMPGPESSEFDRSFHELASRVWGPESSNAMSNATVGVKEHGRVEKKGNARDKREKVSKKPKGEKKKVHYEKEDTKKENYVEDGSIPEKNKMGQEIEEIFRANKKKRKEFPGVVGQSSTIAKVATEKEDKLNKRKTAKEKKIGFPVDESSDNRFKRRRTTDGFAIYSEEELGMGNPDAVMDESNRAKCIKLVIATLALIYEYYETYIHKTPCMTSRFIGDKWIGELLVGHPERFHNMFRMSQTIFLDLLEELQCSHGLHGSSRTTPREVLAMTLYILSHKETIRATCERFQHSSETVSRYFSICLDALVSLSSAVVKPVDSYFDSTPVEIAQDPRYMPFFKDCIGALDGTHVDARVPVSQEIAYIGRCGSPTQNILASCDFNMCFTFIMAGWEGSAHDSRIFKFATQNRQYNFPMPPPGKYYLVDAGFPLQRGFLKPYPDTKYHLPDFQRSGQLIRNRKELFNKRHSSLWGVIERTFGVWKKKWVILRDMPTYPIKKQIKVVAATVALHNYIRRHPSRNDLDFDHVDEDQSYIPPEAHEYQVGHSIEQSDFMVETEPQDGEGAEDMKALREQITDYLANSME